MKQDGLDAGSCDGRTCEQFAAEKIGNWAGPFKKPAEAVASVGRGSSLHGSFQSHSGKPGGAGACCALEMPY